MLTKNNDDIDFLWILRKDLEDHHQEDQTAEEPSQSGDSILPPSAVDHRHHLISIGADIVTRQLPSNGLSFQIWPAAFSFVSLLDLNPSLLLLPTHSPLRILELGSGTGLVGISAAAVLGAHVTLTDLPGVISNIQYNATENAAVAAARGGALAVRQLRWGAAEDFAEIGTAFDAVMASDVVYYDHLIKPLIETLRFFVKGEVVFLMAHLRRWKKRDAVFFRMARKIFEVKMVHADPPFPGSRTGVAVYRFTARCRSPEIA